MSDQRNPRRAPPPASDRLRAAADTVGRWTWRLAGKSSFLLFGAAVYVLVRATVEAAPLAGQIAVLALVYVPLGLLIYVLSKKPDETLAPFRRHGLAQPLLFVSGLWLAAIGWFSSLAFVLAQHGVVDFHAQGSTELPGSERLADFFVWHSFEQIPALAVNDTLQWDVPLRYGDGAGVVVLAFKVLIALPLVPVFLAAWRHRRPAGEPPVAPASAPLREAA